MHGSHRSVRHFRDVPPPSLVASFASTRPAAVLPHTTRPPWVLSNFSASCARSQLDSNPFQRVKRSRAQASIAFAALSPRGPLHRFSAPAVYSQHLRLRVCAFGPLVPTSRSRSVPVVSHHLDGFLRPHSVGLLHPTADPGVHRVASIRPPAPADSEEPTDQHARVVSRDALTPRRYSLPAAPP